MYQLTELDTLFRPPEYVLTFPHYMLLLMSRSITVCAEDNAWAGQQETEEGTQLEVQSLLVLMSCVA